MTTASYGFAGIFATGPDNRRIDLDDFIWVCWISEILNARPEARSPVLTDEVFDCWMLGYFEAIGYNGGWIFGLLKEDGVPTPTMTMYGLSGVYPNNRLITKNLVWNESEPRFPVPFDGRFGGSASATGSLGKATKNLYYPLIQSVQIWVLAFKSASVVAIFGAWRGDFCSSDGGSGGMMVAFVLANADMVGYLQHP